MCGTAAARFRRCRSGGGPRRRRASSYGRSVRRAVTRPRPAASVGLDVDGAVALDRPPIADECRAVHDDVNTLRGARNRFGVLEIALHLLASETIDEARIARRAHQGAHAVAELTQSLGDVASDKAGRTGDQRQSLCQTTPFGRKGATNPLAMLEARAREPHLHHSAIARVKPRWIRSARYGYIRSLISRKIRPWVGAPKTSSARLPSVKRTRRSQREECARATTAILLSVLVQPTGVLQEETVLWRRGRPLGSAQQPAPRPQ